MVRGRQFVKYDLFAVDPLWRRLSDDEKNEGRREFSAVIDELLSDMFIRSFSMVGLRGDADFMLWHATENPRAAPGDGYALVEHESRQVPDSALLLPRPDAEIAVRRQTPAHRPGGYKRKPDARQCQVLRSVSIYQDAPVVCASPGGAAANDEHSLLCWPQVPIGQDQHLILLWA